MVKCLKAGPDTVKQTHVSSSSCRLLWRSCVLRRWKSECSCSSSSCCFWLQLRTGTMAHSGSRHNFSIHSNGNRSFASLLKIGFRIESITCKTMNATWNWKSVPHHLSRAHIPLLVWLYYPWIMAQNSLYTFAFPTLLQGPEGPLCPYLICFLPHCYSSIHLQAAYLHQAIPAG